jgi:hypothetical protein
MITMARYLLSVLTTSSALATDAEMAAIDAFNEQMQIDGNWVFAGGLAGPDTATVVDGTGGDTIFSDGPYLESKEYMVGLWIIEAADMDEALKLASAASRACNRRLELRPFLSE